MVPPPGLVAEIAVRFERDEVPHIAKCRAWSVNEIGEAGMLRVDKAPDHARHDQRADDVVGLHMYFEQIALARVSNGPP